MVSVSEFETKTSFIKKHVYKETKAWHFLTESYRAENRMQQKLY